MQRKQRRKSIPTSWGFSLSDIFFTGSPREPRKHVEKLSSGQPGETLATPGRLPSLPQPVPHTSSWFHTLRDSATGCTPLARFPLNLT